MERLHSEGSNPTCRLLRSVPNRTALTYINVNIGDELGRDVDTSLFACAEGKIRVTVPTAADRVGVSSSRGCVLDTGGGHNADRLPWTLMGHTHTHTRKKTSCSIFLIFFLYLIRLYNSTTLLKLSQHEITA